MKKLIPIVMALALLVVGGVFAFANDYGSAGRVSYDSQTPGVTLTRVSVFNATSSTAMNTVSGNNTIMMVAVPKNAMVTGVEVSTQSVALTASLGDGADTDRYMASTSMNGSGYVVDFANATYPTQPHVYSAADTIDLTITGGSIIGTSANATVKVQYVILQDNDDAADDM